MKLKAQSDMIKKSSSNSFSEVINFIKSLYPGENPVPLHAPRFTGNEKNMSLMLSTPRLSLL